MEKKIKAQKELSAIVVFHICFMQCKNMLVSTSNLYNINSLLNNLAMVTVFALYARAIFKNGLNAAFLRTVGLIAMWWIISKWADPRLFSSTTFPYNYVIENRNTFIAYSLPLFYAATMLESADYILEYLFKVVRIVFLVAAVSFALYIFDPGDAAKGGYSMSFGYHMLLLCTVLMFKYIKERKKTDLLFFVLTTFFIIVGGSRGPLVSIAVLIMYYQWQNKSSGSGLILFIVEIIVLCLIVLFGDSIINLISELLTGAGLSSRTFSMFIDGNMISDTGREQYHNGIFNALKESPILGLGAFGGEKTVGLAHSLYIDIWANMGYIFGTLFMLILAVKLIKNAVKFPNSARTQIIAMMSIIAFPRGFFSDQFWTSWHLWLIMGLLSSARYELKVKKEATDEDTAD